MEEGLESGNGEEMDGLGWIRSLGCREEARNESFPLSLSLTPFSSYLCF